MNQISHVQKLAMLLLIYWTALPVYAQIGPNRIQNSVPNQGAFPYVREGFEPAADSGPFGDDFNNHYTHYFLKNIDHWKYERVNDGGDRYHSVTFDYNTKASDMGYYFGDRWSGFIQSSNSWGFQPLPVQIERTTRTVLRFDVRSRYVPGYTSYFHSTPDFVGDPMNFARETLVTDTVMERPNNAGPITLDFDYWEKTSHLNTVSNPDWWFTGGSLGEDETQYFADEFFPKWQNNNSGVFVMPIEGMRENPEGMVHEQWTSVAIDLSWAYEWTLRLHPERIEDAESYSAASPPSVWRIMGFIEGTNLAANMNMKNIRWEEWNLDDPATRNSYVDLFDSSTTKSYPFKSHWDDYIVQFSSATSLPGDYDHNGVVEAADYDAWKAGYGNQVIAGTGADGNGDGVVDAVDYTLWRNNVVSTSGMLLDGISTPESSTLSLLMLASLSISARALSRWSRLRSAHFR